MRKVCSQCGTVANPAKKTPGSFLIELILWLCFLIPGLIYSLWRISRRHDVCRACGSREVVPINTPVGRRLVEQFESGQSSGRPDGVEKVFRVVDRLIGKNK